MRTYLGFRGLVVAAMIGVSQFGLAADDVASYRIDVALDAAGHRLTGVEEIEWTNPTTAATDELYLHLYLNAFAGPDTTFMRELGPHSWAGGARADDGWGWIRIERMTDLDGGDLLPALKQALADDTVSVIACPVDYSENTKLTEKLGHLRPPL